MKRKLYYLALIPFYALVIAAAIYAGGSSHDNCAECNRAAGKRINAVIARDTGEKIYVVENNLQRNIFADRSARGVIKCIPAQH